MFPCRDGIAENFFCKAPTNGLDGSDAPAKDAVFFQRHKGACPRRGHFFGQILRQLGIPAGFHIRFKAQAGKAHKRIFRFSAFHQFLPALCLKLLAEITRFVFAFHFKRSHTVPDAERAFIRHKAAFHGFPIESASHNPEGTQPALGGGFAEIRIKPEQLRKVAVSERFRCKAVELRPFGCETVGAVLFQLVGEVPARDDDDAAPELFSRCGNALPQPVMHQRRQAGKADAHKPVLPCAGFIQEAERYHGGVVELLPTLPECPRRDLPLSAELRQRLDELRVVLCVHANLRGPEPAEIPLRFPAGRNMEIIRIHHAVRAGQDNRLRLKKRRLPHNGAVGRNGFPDFSLFPVPDFRQNNGRMRHGKSCQNRHHIASVWLFRVASSAAIIPSLDAAEAKIRSLRRRVRFCRIKMPSWDTPGKLVKAGRKRQFPCTPVQVKLDRGVNFHIIDYNL